MRKTSLTVNSPVNRQVPNNTWQTMMALSKFSELYQQTADLKIWQVKNLCKLFCNATKASKQQRGDKAGRAGLCSTNAIQHRSLSYVEILQHSTAGGSDPRILRVTDLYARESYASPPHHVGLYAREGYLSLPHLVGLVALPPPVPAPIYAHDLRVDDYYYRRGPVLEMSDYRIMDVEMRSRVPIEYCDPHSLYMREPVPYRETPYTAG